MFIFLFIVFFTLGIHLIRHGVTLSTLHPFTWNIAFFVLYFSTPPSGDTYRLDVDVLQAFTFLLFSFVFLSFFRCGKFIAPRLLNTFVPARAEVGVFMGRGSLFIVLLFCLVYVMIWSVTRYAYSDDLSQYFFGMYRRPVMIESTALRIFINSGFAVFLSSIMILVVNSRISGSPSSLILSVIILIGACLSFFEGVRGQLLLILVVVLISNAIAAAHTNRALLGVFNVFIITVSVLAIFVLTAVRSELILTLSDLTEVVKNNLLSMDQSFSRNIEGSLNINESLAFILDHYRFNAFDYFHSFYSISVNWIPRDLWSDKPVGYGLLLADYVGFSRGSGVSLAAGIAGEGYANGGLLGVLLLTMFVGMLTGFSGGVAFFGFTKSGSAIKVFLSSLFFSVSIFFVRGDMLSAWGSTVYPLIAILMIMLLVKSVSAVGRKPLRRIKPTKRGE